MQQTLTVADAFHTDPLKIREAALALEYKTARHNGHEYHGVAMADTRRLWSRLEHLLGRRVKCCMDFFRAGNTGMVPTTYIHADRDMGEWAGVLYLNTPEQRFGGTAFWRHMETGWHGLPYGGVPMELAWRLMDEGMDDTKWELTTKVGMEFNRFITYPTRLFHSRYPNHIEAPGVASGRLVWCCFYDLA